MNYTHELHTIYVPGDFEKEANHARFTNPVGLLCLQLRQAKDAGILLRCGGPFCGQERLLSPRNGHRYTSAEGRGIITNIRPCISLQMFSDSLYLALSAETLDELIKPEDEAEWKVVKQQRFPRPEHRAYDKRTPGMIL